MRINGLVFLYTFIILYRLVGVGEASFISLAAPFIDDNAPASQVCFFPCKFIYIIRVEYLIKLRQSDHIT